MSNKSNNNGRAFERIVHACLNLCLVSGAQPSAICNTAVQQEASRIYPDSSQISLCTGILNNCCDSARKLAGFLINAIACGNKVVKIENYEDSRSASDLDPSDLGVRFSDNSVLGISCKVNHNASSHDRISASQGTNNASDTVVNWLDSNWVSVNTSAVKCFKNYIKVLFDTFEKKAGVTPGVQWSALDEKMKYQLYTYIARGVSSFLKKALQDSQNSQKLLRRIFGSRPYFKVIMDSKNNNVTIHPILIDYNSAQLNPSACGIALRGVSLASMNAQLSPRTALLGKKLFEYLVIAGTTNNNPWEWQGRLHTAKGKYERSLKFDFRMHPKNAMESIFGKPLII